MSGRCRAAMNAYPFALIVHDFAEVDPECAATLTQCEAAAPVCREPSRRASISITQQALSRELEKQP